MRAAERTGRLEPTAYTRGYGRWQVSFFRDGKEVVQVQVDDASGTILEQWSGYEVAWRMARGYSGAFGRKLNAPYVWLPLCVLFLAPFVAYGVEAGLRYSDPAAIAARLDGIIADLRVSLAEIDRRPVIPFNRKAEWGADGRIVPDAPVYSPFIRRKAKLDFE